jgi:hypothetical protein
MASAPKKLANQTTYTKAPAGTPAAATNLAYTPPNTFSVPGAQAPAQVTNAPSTLVGDSPAYNAARAGTAGVPQSFSDGLAQLITSDNAQRGYFNYNGVKYDIPAGDQLNQAWFDKTAKSAWDSLPADKQAEYISQDKTTVAGINTTNTQNSLNQSALSAPATDAAFANKAWQPVTAAQQNATGAIGAQVAGDRQAEGQLNTDVGNYTNTIGQNQTARMQNIADTNNRDTGYAQDFMGQTLATNQANTGFANQLTDAANSTNANQSGLAATNAASLNNISSNQTGLFNTYSGQAAALNANQSGLFSDYSGQVAGINANQSGLYNNFMGDIASANTQQNQNLNGLGTAVNDANYNQNVIVDQYMQQLNSMNEQDKTAYLQYIQETDPLTAQMIAQASNPAYVANQEDVVQKYKDLSTPQVTDQERYLAELARQKFESDDQGNREALMQQLAGRGLKSGGLVIAGQQQAQQQLSQDRLTAELGLNANAVQRGLQGLAGYASASSTLRNADDAMKNFQDQYAQNDAVRRANLAQQRDQQNLNTTGQITNRDTAGYNAQTQSNSLNYGRNLDYYNAGTQTVNDDFSRTQAGYNAGTQTNEDNANRDNQVFNAGTTTNEDNGQRDYNVFTAGTTTNNSNTDRANDIFNNGTTTNTDNFGRTTSAIGTQLGTSQTNLGNYQSALTGPSGLQTVNDANNTRYQGGLTTGDQTAGSILGAQTGAIGFQTGNLGSEASNAVGYVPTATNTATQAIQTQEGLSQESKDALAAILSGTTKAGAKAAAGMS